MDGPDPLSSALPATFAGTWRKGPAPAAGYRWNHAYERPFPGLPALAHINEAVCTAAHRLAPHAHPTWELCFFHAGRAAWTCGGRRHLIGPGDFFIVRPGELHGGRPDPRQPNHNFAVGFDPRHLGRGGGALLAAVAAGRDLGSAVEGVEAAGGARVIRAGAAGQEATALLRRILAELDAARVGGPLQRALGQALVEALLIELLVLVTRCAIPGAAPVPVTGPTPEIAAPLIPAHLRRAAELAERRLADPPSVAELAAAAGLGPSRFSAAFHAAYGAPPLDWLTGRRVAAAGALLRQGRTVTEAALALGFASPQYFAAVFRRRTGRSPSAWRAAAGEDPAR